MYPFLPQVQILVYSNIFCLTKKGHIALIVDLMNTQFGNILVFLYHIATPSAQLNVASESGYLQTDMSDRRIFS